MEYLKAILFIEGDSKPRALHGECHCTWSVHTGKVNEGLCVNMVTQGHQSCHEFAILQSTVVWNLSSGFGSDRHSRLLQVFGRLSEWVQ